MKKLAAILLLAIYVFSTTDAHELLKLPVIFQHFIEHKEENRNISFLQFISMHYMHGNPIDKDHDRDMQLPFKTPCSCAFSSAPPFVALMQRISIESPVEISHTRHSILKDSFINSFYLSKIWQPPRAC